MAELGQINSTRLYNIIKHLLDKRKLKWLKQLVNHIQPEELAGIIRYFRATEIKYLLGVVNKEFVADVISATDWKMQEYLLNSFTDKQIGEILSELPDDEIADILGDVPEQKLKRIISLLSADTASDIENLLRYPEESAGGIMTTEFIHIPQDCTVEEAINIIRSHKEIERVYYIYVVDAYMQLLGLVPLRKLIVSPANMKVSEITIKDIISVRDDTDQEQVARIVSEYDIESIPVVNIDNKLLGEITFDDIIDVIEQEATEDLFKITGAGDDRLYVSSVFKTAFLRLPWLGISFVGELISGMAILNYFAKTLEEMITLSFFMPVIMAMGGNVGTQSATIVIRGLATGKIKFIKVWKVLFREMGIGLLMGSVCGLLVALSSKILESTDIKLSFIVGISMFSAITLAATVGTSIPLISKKLKFDPAIAAGPFVTTFNDIAGLAIYLGMATWMLQYL